MRNQARDTSGAEWVACHDTLVCAGGKQIQKWCVREGHDKGPLVAVMLTKDVAFMLAAAPALLEKSKKIVAWLERLAIADEARGKDNRFPSLAKACREDAANYRKTAADISKVVAEAEGRAP